MENTVFLNLKKVNFDNKFNFSTIAEITNLTKYDESSDEKILERVKDQAIIITKELQLGRKLISQFPTSVKLICEAGTGYNNIDIVAALDAQYPEPPVLTNPLFDMENVILTPHIGWRRFESRQRLIDLMALNIESFIQGKSINVVN